MNVYWVCGESFGSVVQKKLQLLLANGRKNFHLSTLIWKTYSVKEAQNIKPLWLTGEPFSFIVSRSTVRRAMKLGPEYQMIDGTPLNLIQSSLN